MYTQDAQIEEFVEYYQRSRVVAETTVRAVLRRAVAYEKKFQKPFYKYNKEEILQMYTEASAISARSLQNWNLILEHAAKYFLYHADEKVIEEYENIIKQDLVQCVVKPKLISREQLNNIEGDLLNAIDVAIVEMLFLGAAGEWFKELTFLNPSNVSRKDLKVYFRTGRAIKIDAPTYMILESAFNEKQIKSYAIEPTLISVIGDELYKRRGNTLHNSNKFTSEQDMELRYRWVQRRLKIMSDYLGIKLTPKILHTSGLWQTLNDKKRTLGIDDFRSFLATAEAQQIAKQYGFAERYYEQILMDKFKAYI